MATIGELTKSGLLYEGNYDEWLPRILSSLRFTGLPLVDDEDREHLKVKRQFFSSSITVAGSEVSGPLIRGAVSPRLYDRIPFDARDDLEMLMIALKRQAVTFDLMGLPKEVIGLVCDLSINTRKSVMVGLPSDGETDLETVMPAIAHVNRACRREALRAFYSLSTFYLCTHTRGLREPGELSSVARTWASAVGQPQLRWVRKISFSMHISAGNLPPGEVRNDISRRGRCTLVWDVKDGIKILFRSSHETVSRGDRSYHSRQHQITETAKALEMHGEALIMAITAYRNCGSLEPWNTSIHWSLHHHERTLDWRDTVRSHITSKLHTSALQPQEIA